MYFTVIISALVVALYLVLRAIFSESKRLVLISIIPVIVLLGLIIYELVKTGPTETSLMNIPVVVLISFMVGIVLAFAFGDVTGRFFGGGLYLSKSRKKPEKEHSMEDAFSEVGWNKSTT